MPTVHLGDLDVYYEHTDGGGPRLLYCNGSGATIERSRPAFAPFSAFDFLIHDQRGLGRTGVPDGPYTMAQYAADAIALLDHLGWETCRVIGVSFGGMVAQELAVTVPERIERLVLACTSPGGPSLSSYPLHTLPDLPPEERAARYPQLLDTRFDAEWLATHPADREVITFIAASQTVEKSPQQLQGERLQLEARMGHDVVDRLRRITCPTLVAAGRYDGIAPLSNSEAIAARVPNARLAAYEGGHLFMMQDPAAMPEMVTFLAES